MKAAADLAFALDRVSFASSLGLDPDPWQERLLRSTSPRVLLNCSRQSGKSNFLEQEQDRILSGPAQLVAATALYRVPLQALLRILESVC